MGSFPEEGWRSNARTSLHHGDPFGRKPVSEDSDQAPIQLHRNDPGCPASQLFRQSAHPGADLRTTSSPVMAAASTILSLILRSIRKFCPRAFGLQPVFLKML